MNPAHIWKIQLVLNAKLEWRMYSNIIKVNLLSWICLYNKVNSKQKSKPLGADFEENSDYKG